MDSEGNTRDKMILKKHLKVSMLDFHFSHYHQLKITLMKKYLTSVVERDLLTLYRFLMNNEMQQFNGSEAFNHKVK